MSKIKLKQLLQKKGIRITFLIVCSIFIPKNTFSIKKWDRKDIRISFDQSDRSIEIEAPFIDYEFGPLGEHAYFEWANFDFTLDGLKYERLFRIQVVYRLKGEWSWVCMEDKFLGANIQFLDFNFSESGPFWKEGESEVCLKYYNKSNKCYFRVKWFVSDNFIVKDIRLSGKWYLNGLFCSENISDQKYIIANMSALKSDVLIDSKKEYGNASDCQPNVNTVKVSTEEANVVLIQGADSGENICVYSTSGALLKSMVADGDVLNIMLPTNQIYIVKVGQERFKLSLFNQVF